MRFSHLESLRWVSHPVRMLFDCWDMFVKFSITCCSTGEAKPAAASSHAVRVMGPEVLDSGGGQPGQQERGVEGAGGGRVLSLLSEEPPPVNVPGSVYWNSNRDTLYQFIPESAAPNLDTKSLWQTQHFFAIFSTFTIHNFIPSHTHT